MKALSLLAISLLFLGAGCATAQKPEPEPEPMPAEVLNPDIPVYEINLDGDTSTPLMEGADINEIYTGNTDIQIEFEPVEE
jgi:hypothetical protein